jgi:hypothetical protein
MLKILQIKFFNKFENFLKNKINFENLTNKFLLRRRDHLPIISFRFRPYQRSSLFVLLSIGVFNRKLDRLVERLRTDRIAASSRFSGESRLDDQHQQCDHAGAANRGTRDCRIY